MMECLPKDLWVQIFLRLPVKTLLRCLSVCKSWQLFIQHPLFINSHLQYQRRDLILVRSITEDKKEKLGFLKSDDEETVLAKKTKSECYSLYCDDESFPVYSKHELPIHCPSGGHYRIVGICNGVICITDDDYGGIHHDTYLWNPTIQKCIELPYPMFTFKNIGPFDHELGFGFDEKTDDYKVVRVVQKSYLGDAPLEVEIYSLSSGIWRKASHLASHLGVRIFPRWGTGNNFQVYLKGTVHWVAEDRKQHRWMVFAFYLGDEVFRCFKLPLGIKHNIGLMRKLRPVVFQGSLSLILYNQPKCSIWIMKDYGDSTSWAKYVDVNLSNHIARVIGLRKKGELLFEIIGSLFSYEPTKGKDFMYLNEEDLWHRELFRDGDMGRRRMNYVTQHVYDPECAPKELGVRSNTKDTFRYSFYVERYIESLVLLGSTNSAEMAKLEAKESERIHDEDNKCVANPVDELQNMGGEGRQC